ncbi:MAG: GNAT family N-acetyltransferase [Alphaproteobacteria bacterium]|nr:GNAT family N-acetyltransferase [Alphaproteobacteria bacterium]
MRLTAPETLDTPRLSLRPWTEADADALFAILAANAAHLRPWVPFARDLPRDGAEALARIERYRAQHAEGSALRFAVRHRTSLVGEAMLFVREGGCELGYWIAADHEDRGYATEATRALVEVAFDQGIDAISIRCEAANAASNAVARRLGAHLERDETVPSVRDDTPVPLSCWVLTTAAHRRSGSTRTHA